MTAGINALWIKTNNTEMSDEEHSDSGFYSPEGQKMAYKS